MASAILIKNKFFPVDGAEEMIVAREFMRICELKSAKVWIMDNAKSVPYETHMVFLRDYPPIFTKKKKISQPEAASIWYY